MNSATYKVNLPAGKYDKRFAIRISEHSEIPTEITETTGNGNDKLHILRDGQQLYIEELTHNETLTSSMQQANALLHNHQQWREVQRAHTRNVSVASRQQNIQSGFQLKSKASKDTQVFRRVCGHSACGHLKNL